MHNPEQIEQRAAELLDEFASTRTLFASGAFPLDVRGIVMNHLDLNLEPQPDPRDPRGRRLLGGLLLSSGTPRIIYRMHAGPAERERFVIAHEVGHYILHRGDSPDYYCTEQDMEERESEHQGHRRWEWEANLFSSALLMPRSELRERYEAWKGDPERLMEHFGVSREALYWRMVLLGLAPAWSAPSMTSTITFRGVRVLHFADAHIGAEHVGRWTEPVRQQRRGDFLRAVESTVKAAIDHEVDVLLFAGDAFQDRAPSNEDQKALARALWPAIAGGKEVVIVIGNHDRPASGNGTHSLWTYGEFARWLSLPNVHVAEEPAIFHLDTGHGPLDVAVMPYVPPILVGAAQPDRNPHEAVLEWADEELGRLASLRRTDVPSLLAGHLTVVGAALGAERHLMASASRDLCLPVSLLTRDGWDYVGLGHIHRAQSTGPVVYSGSLERVDFGEEGQPKGFVLADLVNGATKWRFVPLEGTRVFRTLSLTVTAEEDPTQAIVDVIRRENLQDALVRIQVELFRSQVKQIQARPINQALEAASALAWNRPEFDFVEPPALPATEVEAAVGNIDPSQQMETLRIYLSLRKDLKADMPALIRLAEEIEQHPDLEANLARRVRKGG